VDDIDNVNDAQIISEEQQSGSITLADLCMENETIPKVGWAGGCASAATAVSIVRYDDLQNRAEFKDLLSKGKEITPRDIMAINIKLWQKPPYSISGIQILNTAEKQVTLGSSSRNMTAMNVTWTYQVVPRQAGIPPLLSGLYNSITPAVTQKAFTEYMVANDNNTAYVIGYLTYNTSAFLPPMPIRVIMDSFQPLKQT
jgi:hypothetical protein